MVRQGHPQDDLFAPKQQHNIENQTAYLPRYHHHHVPQSKGEQVEEEEAIGAVEYYDSLLLQVRRKPNTRLGAAAYLV